MPTDQPPKFTDFIAQLGDTRQAQVAYEKMADDSIPRGPMSLNATKQDLPSGPIKSIDIPNSWTRTDHYDGGVGATVTFKAPGEKASINSLERTRPISDHAAEEFKKLLDANDNLTSPKMLLPAQLRSLTEVLGSGQMGDNQYTNPEKYPSPNAPLFKLTNAQFLNVNGKTVVEVEGSYMDEKGRPTEFYRGIFAPSGKDGDRVNELFLAAPSQQDLLSQESNYRKALKSLKWH